MKRKFKAVFYIVICAAALAISAAVFLSASKYKDTHRENQYSLSDDRAFGLTNLDSVVESIRAALKNRSKTIGINLTLKGEYMDDISPFVKELMNLAMEHTGEADEGEYIKYQTGGYTFNYGHEPTLFGYRYSIEITPDYYSTRAQEEETAAKAAEIISEFNLPEDAGEYEKIKAVYDYLAQNVKYDKVHKNSKYYTEKSTAYAALVKNYATCQGYAVAMYRLLTQMGVECHIITGDGYTGDRAEFHAWNIVRIGDEFYYADPTWNYSVRPEDYFLKGSKDFTDHIHGEEFEGLYDVAEYGYEE